MRANSHMIEVALMMVVVPPLNLEISQTLRRKHEAQ
jgi:hypothetical protein